MLELVIGSQKNPHAKTVLWEAFSQYESEWTGTLYVGYPIIASAEGPISVDGLLCCKEHGLVVFDFESFDGGFSAVEARQDEVHAAVFRKLYDTKELRRGRQGLKIDISVITVSPKVDGSKRSEEVVLANPEKLASVVSELPPMSQELLALVNASIERVSNLKPYAKRPQVTRTDSRGAIIGRIEKEIANLDSWQKKAAIEAPEGPQRIRGLAGSGKTIVLALKAAYLHAQNPDWDIVLTFHTRSLYQQLRDLVLRFSFEQMSDEPNWDKLRILHAWGSSRYPGVYSTIASAAGQHIRDFDYGKRTYGYNEAFEGVSAELLEGLRDDDVPQIFDAVLIDEAQDLPRQFFELAYLASKPPHRVVWAYDELQNLTRHTMPPLEELFGKTPEDVPRVPGLRTDAAPKEDIILPVCYRNTPWALSVAHALGFGVYREEGLVQFFDDPQLWEEIGYEVVRGKIEPDSHVELRRARQSYPRYFEELLDPEDAVATEVFDTPNYQAEWVAESIRANLEEDELRHQDILVIVCNALRQKADAARVMKALADHGVSAHLAGVTTSVDTLYREDSIAVSGIFRAKGNEAPMVYVLHSEYGAQSGLELIKRRNVLFTAITRSRAWVRVCGVGSRMVAVKREVEAVVKNDYSLSFSVPSVEELKRLRRIHRDMPEAEKSRISAAEKEFREILSRIERGELPPEVISDDLLELVRRVHD